MKSKDLLCLVVLTACGISANALHCATPTESAKTEYDEIMALEPNVENGRKVYLTCAVCHRPEGWGTPDGSYPQIAGQLRTVIIKQLADIRAGNRDNPLMYPFSMPSILGGKKDIADVAAYVAQLPMMPNNGVGPGNDLELGKQLYADNCAKCHGEQGEGNLQEHIPALAGQHYNYLLRQFELILNNRRKNADPKMVKQIQGFSPREEIAVLDYTSRLRPPAHKVATQGWRNPDFPHFIRPTVPDFPAIEPMPAEPEPPPMPTESGMPEPPVGARR